MKVEIAVSVAATVARAALSVAVTPYVVSGLGIEGYAQFVLLLSASPLIALGESVLSSSYRRGYFGLNQDCYRNRLRLLERLSSGLSIIVGVSLLSVACLLVSITILSPVGYGDWKLFYFVGAFVILGATSALFFAEQMAVLNNRFLTLRFMEVGMAVVTSIVILSAERRYFTVLSVLLFVFLPTIVARIAFLVTYGGGSHLALRPSICYALARRNFAFGGVYSFNQLLLSICQAIQPWLIASGSDSRDVALYGVAGRVTGVFLTILQSVAAVLIQYVTLSAVSNKALPSRLDGRKIVLISVFSAVATFFLSCIVIRPAVMWMTNGTLVAEPLEVVALAILPSILVLQGICSAWLGGMGTLQVLTKAFALQLAGVMLVWILGVTSLVGVLLSYALCVFGAGTLPLLISILRVKN